MQAGASLGLGDDAAPEVVLVGHGGGDRCQAGVAGSVGYGAQGDGLDLAVVAPAVLHQATVGLLGLQQPSHGVALMAGVMTQSIGFFDEFTPGVVLPAGGVAAAVGVAGGLAAGVVAQGFAPPSGIDDGLWLVGPSAVGRGQCVWGALLVLQPCGAGQFACKDGDLGQAAPFVIGVVGVDAAGTGALQQQTVLRCTRQTPALLAAAAVGALHAQQVTLAVVPPVDGAAQRVGGGDTPACAVVLEVLFAAVGVDLARDALETATSFVVVRSGAPQAVAHGCAAGGLGVLGGRVLVAEVVAQAFFVVVFDDAGAGVVAFIDIAVFRAAAYAVGKHAVLAVVAELARALAVAGMHGNEVALGAVVVAHQGHGVGGAAVVRVVNAVHARQAQPGIDGASTGGLNVARVLRWPALAVVQQGVAAACAVGDGSQPPVFITVVLLGAAEGIHQANEVAVSVGLGLEEPGCAARLRGGQDVAGIQSGEGGDVGPALLVHPGQEFLGQAGRGRAVVSLSVTAAQQQEGFAVALQGLACAQGFVKGDDAATGVVQKGLGGLELKAQLVWQVPTPSQKTALWALFRIDVAAVLALPDQGHGAGQCEVQVFGAEQDLGAQGGVDGAANGFATGAGGARYAALGADQDRVGALDDRASRFRQVSSPGSVLAHDVSLD